MRNWELKEVNCELGIRNEELGITSHSSFQIPNSSFPIPHSSLTVAVERKAIKHTHLSVFPPDARVHVSAPLDLPDADIRSYLISKLPWLRKQIAVVLSQSRQTRREYVSGEDIYLLGKRYRLVVRKSAAAPSVCIKGQDIVLSGRGLESRVARAKKIDGWYREKLRCVLTRILDRYAVIVGETDAISFEIRRMRNLWGACTSRTRRIRFNLALVRVPRRCIEYVVMHELIHLSVPNHSLLFERKMDKFMPRWREARKELNEFIDLPLE